MEDNSIKAVKYLIKQAPAGEIQDVLQHLHTLVGSPDLINQSDQIMQALKLWFETHKYHILLPEGNKVLVTAQGCLATGEETNPMDQFKYYDDVAKVVFTFDPITQAGSVVEEAAPELPTCQLRNDLKEQMVKYIDEKYRKGKALFCVTQGDGGEGH